MNKCIAVVDIETTGFLPDGKIVEIGIVELCLETGNKTPLYNELVKEEGFGEEHKGSWIFENSDLTYEEVDNAQPLDFETLQTIFNNYNATAFNKRFDFDFLISRGLVINELQCPMKLSTNICKIPGSRGGYKWPKVQEAWDFFFGINTDYIEEHRGFDDALHEAEIVLQLYRQGIFEVPGVQYANA